MKYQTTAALGMTCLFLVVQLLTGFAQKNGDATKVKFIASDDREPVEGNVHYLSRQGIHKVIGHSNAGTATLDTVPQNGEELYFEPDSTDYVYTPFKWAPPGSTVVVDRRPRSVSIIALLDGLAKATRESNQAVIALIANELSTRSEVKHKRVYEQVSNQAAAKVFEVPLEEALVYDPQQKKTVPSENLTTAVKQYQKDNGLTVTGELNYPTLKTKSGTSIGDVLTTFSHEGGG
jgi:hypothetical protein